MMDNKKSIFNPKYRDFIASMIQRRKSLHMTQRELAKKLNTSHCCIARTETHERRIDLTESIALMRALEMSDKQIVDEIKKLL